MEKLKNGDFCENLTKEQFDELIDIEDSFMSIPYFEKPFLYFEEDGLYLHNSSMCKNLLSFEDFKQRAINTFKKQAMTEEKAERLIGRKVRGFKFKQGIDNVYYNPFMGENVGKIGEVTDFLGNSFKVQFIDRFWEYPASLIEAHLEEEGWELKIEDLETDTSEIEQLKSDKEEFLKLLESFITEYDNQESISLNGSLIGELINEFRQTLEKHGK